MNLLPDMGAVYYLLVAASCSFDFDSSLEQNFEEDSLCEDRRHGLEGNILDFAHMDNFDSPLDLLELVDMSVEDSEDMIAESAVVEEADKLAGQVALVERM